MANDSAEKAFREKLSTLYNDISGLADFTIMCEDRRWNVHRVVLTLHSDVLKKSCTGDFKEFHEKKIDLTEDHTPDQVNALVDYMYTFQYTYTATTDFQDTVKFHVNMAVLADKYDIGGLHKFATNPFIELDLDTAESLAAAAKAAYAAPGATGEIRKSIVSSVVLRKGLLDGEENNPLAQAMEENGTFALEVARALARPKKQDAPSKYQCPGGCPPQEIPNLSSYEETFCCICRNWRSRGQWTRISA